MKHISDEKLRRSIAASNACLANMAEMIHCGEPSGGDYVLVGMREFATELAALVAHHHLMLMWLVEHQKGEESHVAPAVATG